MVPNVALYSCRSSPRRTHNKIQPLLFGVGTVSNETITTPSGRRQGKKHLQRTESLEALRRAHYTYCPIRSSPNPTEAALVHSLAVKKLLRFVKCFHRTTGYCAEHLSTLSCPIPLCSSVMISSLTDEKPEVQRTNLPKISYFVHGQAGFKSLNLHCHPSVCHVSFEITTTIIPRRGEGGR